MAQAPSIKTSFNLPADELQALRDEADRRNVTVTQVLREALADHHWLNDQVRQSNKVLIKSSEGEIGELILPNRT
jgi:hypothetical protein